MNPHGTRWSGIIGVFTIGARAAVCFAAVEGEGGENYGGDKGAASKGEGERLGVGNFKDASPKRVGDFCR
jgi:hypothetical protein